MNPIFDLGIAIILFLQSLGEWLVAPMRLFSFLGNEEFFLFVAPAIYWCISPALGLRLGLTLMVSSAVNAALKLIFHAPRPYWYSAEVDALSAETSFGAPSGHAQHAVVVWGGLAAFTGRTWAWGVAASLILLIGFSRVYLGVHFPADVLFGWAIGAALLWGALRLEKPFVARLLQQDLPSQILTVFGASLVLILLGAGIKLSLGAWTVPTGWLELALRAVPDGDPIEPLALSPLMSHAGTFFGLALGAILLHTLGGFDVSGPWPLRLARFVLGVAGVFVLWYGLGAIFPRGETWLPYLLRYFRYGLVGLWITGLAPLAFIRFRLANRLEPASRRMGAAQQLPSQ